MLNHSPWKAYRQIATQTASPGQLILMLFDGALRFLEQARTGFAAKDPLEMNEAVNNNILRAQAIIHELNVSLNMHDGGALADTLRQLYNYFDRRLTDSNFHKQTDGLCEVHTRLTILRDAWAEMLTQQTVAIPSESFAPLCA
jgi:flagellar protein FliS